MRELTTYDLDTELAEQLPARELMGCWKPHNKGGDTNQTATGGDGGVNVGLQANVLNINVAGDQSNTNSQDASGGDATNIAF
jgi:hypothetical protein